MRNKPAAAIIGSQVARTPKGVAGSVRNEVSHLALSALPIPTNHKVQAFTTQEALDKWGEDAAGVRALVRGDNVITIFGSIGADFWSEDGGITAKKIGAQLQAIGERPVEVQINSPGGDVFEGIAIYNVLREHPFPITVKVMGMAASAASIIAMAGDEIQIGAASFLMIHNCWVMAVGNRHDLAETAAWLEPFDMALAQVYAQRTKQDIKQIQKWLDAETYMSGATAIERGFADSLLPSDQLTQEESTQAADRNINEIRALELSLVRAGLTRSDARARIQKIKGAKPGAGSDEGATTPGAGGFGADFMASAKGLLETIQGKGA